jgi:hypothetical protein
VVGAYAVRAANVFQTVRSRTIVFSADIPAASAHGGRCGKLVASTVPHRAEFRVVGERSGSGDKLIENGKLFLLGA